MNFEERLSAELSGVADGLERPDVSVPGLERLGRREQVRRRTALVAAGAAAAVLVVIAAGTLPKLGSAGDPGPAIAPSTPSKVDPSAPPETLADLPEGPATDLPWVKAGVLHVSGFEIEVGLQQVLFRGGTTLVGGGVSDVVAWYLVDGDRLVHLPGAGRPLISPDGSSIAWPDELARESIRLNVSDVTYRLVSYDVATGAVVGTHERTERVTCCDAGGVLMIQGIGADGRVVTFTIGGEGAQIWDPGNEPVEIVGMTGLGVEGVPSWPGGVMYLGPGADSSDDPATFATIGADGSVSPVGQVDVSQGGIWSDDGSTYAFDSFADGIVVQYFETSADPTRGLLRLPVDLDWRIVAWESTDELVLAGYGDGDEPPLAGLIRCDVRSLECERIADGPTGEVELPGIY